MAMLLSPKDKKSTGEETPMKHRNIDEFAFLHASLYTHTCNFCCEAKFVLEQEKKGLIFWRFRFQQQNNRDIWDGNALVSKR